MIQLIDGTYYNLPLKVGGKIKFEKEKKKYTIQASNVAFCVCTKPFNPKKTVLYTVIDWRRQDRGTENLIFGLGAENKKQCEEMLERLTSGKSEVSHRNYIKLDIETYED